MMMMNMAQNRPYTRNCPAIGPRQQKGFAKRVIQTRFQEDRIAERSITKPALDQELGSVLAPEYANCPPILVAEAQLKQWLGASEMREFKTAQVVTVVKGADASLAVCGTIVEANGAQHAVLALAVKGDTKRDNLPGLILHWATSKRQGDKWQAPPPSTLEFPVCLIPDRTVGGASKTKFATLSSPDGKPLHVVLLQVTLEGFLSTGGGISFVLNSGSQWMHNPEGGGDWFIPLSGWLPLAGDTTDLPDKDLYPASLAPSADDPQEVSDRALLSHRPAREAELRVELRVAEGQEEKANARMVAAAAALREAEGVLSSASKAEEIAKEGVVKKAQQELALAESDLTLITERESIANQMLETARAKLPAVEAALAEAEQLASKLSEVLASIGVEDASWAIKKVNEISSPAEKVTAQAAKLLAIKAESAAAIEAVSVKHEALVDAQSALASAASAHSAARLHVSELRKAKKQAASETKSEVDLALAARRLAEQRLRDLAAESAAAEARVSSRVMQRQLLELKRWLSLEGPSTPLNLKWLLPSSMSGRNMPAVPGGASPRLSIKSPDVHSGDGEEGIPLTATQCSSEDLQSVIRSQVRTWLRLTTSQELHVLQFKYNTRTADGAELPVLVWLTAKHDLDEEGRVQAVVAFAIDQSAARSSRLHGLQLHWGGVFREGQTPTTMPGPGWISNTEGNCWETGDGSMVTPLSAERVQVLDIGGGMGHRRYLSYRAAQLALQVQFGRAFNEDDASDSPANGGLARAAAVAAASLPGLPQSAPEKWAFTGVLQLPLCGIFSQGGLSFSFKDSSGHQLCNSGTRQPFFIGLEGLAQNGLEMIKILAAPPPPPVVNEPVEATEGALASASAMELPTDGDVAALENTGADTLPGSKATGQWPWKGILKPFKQ